MKQTAQRLAESISKNPLNLQRASATLLPPVPLYRQLLRCHRYLPQEMRALGDVYIKAEFRRHRAITNPQHILGFLVQWKIYLDELPREAGAPFVGKKLDPTVFEKMSPEQLGQLYELLNATKDAFRPPVENS
ncbi:hypothetical protein C8J56DRAFT_363086 [Mycena floridula]|nr:hypothetical protein C8J56DRAFT_363086 [Mycena floridula]